MGPVSAAPLAPSKAHSPLLSSSHRPSGAGPGSGRDATAPACLCREWWKLPTPLPNVAAGVQCPRLQSSAFQGRNEWKPGGRGRNGLATPSYLIVQREPDCAWDIPPPHRFGVMQQAPTLQDSMAGSTPKTGCINPAGNRLPGKAPGKGQAVWDRAMGRAAGLHPHCCLPPQPQGQTLEEGSGKRATQAARVLINHSGITGEESPCSGE